MKSSVEPQEGNLVKMTITVPAADVDRAIADAYTKVAKEVRIPGFRKGKAPRKVIDTYVGRPQVLRNALEDVVEGAYDKALDENGLRTIDNPDLGELDELTEGADYTFAAEVQIRPELTLEDDWRNLKIEVTAPVVSGEEIDAQLEHLRERFASLEPVEGRGLEVGDFALISFVGLVDGEMYEGNVVDKYLYESGAGQMPREFDDALVGAKPGDEVHVEFPIPDTSSNPDFVGKIASFDITVHEVKAKQLPALDDEFAATAGGFDSLEEARTEIRERLQENKQAAHDREVEQKTVQALAAHAVGDVPEVMITRRRDSMMRDFFTNLQQRGISMADYHNATGLDPEQITNEMTEQATARVREELALEAAFRAEGMEVTDEDIEGEIQLMASAGEEKTAEEFRKEWEDAGLMPVITEAVMQQKAARWLVDHVQVVDVQPEAAEASAEEKPKKARKSTKKKEEE